MTALLYIGAANLAQPTSGMDIGSRCHLEELFDDGRFAVTAISATSSSFAAGAASRPVQMFDADIGRPTSRLGRLALKAGILARGGILFQTGSASARARAAIRARLAGHPALLFVDHATAMANLSLWRLIGLRLRGRTKIVVVAHDISSMLLRDQAAMQASRMKALAVRLHALHCHLYETLLFRIADRVWFVSTDDRRRALGADDAKSDAACQIIEWPVLDDAPDLVAASGPYLIFTGSPSFFPNRAAIEWITDAFAPEMLERMPALQILLVGKGTERAEAAGLPNLRGLGFVDDARLNRLVHGAAGTLSPVVHGAGIKIKVLEAIAAGCPVFATEHSLSGYEFLQIEPLLDVADPAGSAERVCAIVGDPAALQANRARLARRWAEYKRFRRGRLAAFVHGLVGAPRPAPAGLRDERVRP